MNRRFLGIILTILLVLTQMPLSFAVKYKTATVVAVSGAVSILKAGGEKAITPTLNMALEHGDRIITGKKSSIALKIEGDQYIKVGEKTYMSLSELMSEAESGGDSTNIKLFTGKVWASISKPLGGDDTFEIETPTAVMGAKGTKFLVKYAVPNTNEKQERTDTELVVLEGTVGLRTRVEGQFDNDAPLETQEIEILVGVNESVLLDQRLVQGISDQIQSLIESGQPLENINIQEVVKEVANVQNIKVANLDLFMLEIIADEPQAFDPAFQEGLDQLIEQKTNALPPEDGNTGLEDILGSNTGAFDGAGIRYDNDPNIPSTLPPPTTPTNNDKDDQAGGGSGGGYIPPVNPPVDPPATDVLQITQVKTLDLVDDDGICDHIKITFNKAVNDTTYNPDSGITLNSSGHMGGIISSAISYTAIPNEVNQSGDTSIVLALDTLEKTAYTLGSGSLSIPNAGIISATDGSSLAVVSNFALTDGIAPILSQVTATRQGDAVDKKLMLIFSEPIKPLDSSYMTSGVSISSNINATFQTAVPLNALEADVSLQGLAITVGNLSNSIIKQLTTGTQLFTNSESSFILEDDFGNQREYSNKEIGITLADTDTTPARITGVQLITLDSDAYVYGLKFIFSDYISDPTIAHISSTYDEIVYTQDSSGSTKTSSANSTVHYDASNIYVVYYMDLDAPLNSVDVFDLTFNAPWLDFQGYTVRDDINVPAPSLHIINVNNKWVIYHESTPLSTATAAVENYEALTPLNSTEAIDIATNDILGNGDNIRQAAVDALAAISVSNPTEHIALQARLTVVDSLINSKTALINSITQMASDHNASTLTEAHLASLAITANALNLEAYKAVFETIYPININTATKIETLVTSVDTQVTASTVSDVIYVYNAKKDLTSLPFSVIVGNTATEANPIIVPPNNHANGAIYVFPAYTMTPTGNGGTATVDGNGNLAITRDTLAPYNFDFTINIISNSAQTTSVFNVSVPNGTDPVTALRRLDLE